MESRFSPDFQAVTHKENRFSLYGLGYVGAILACGTCLWINLPCFKQTLTSPTHTERLDSSEIGLVTGVIHQAEKQSIAPVIQTGLTYPRSSLDSAASSGSTLQPMTLWKTTHLKSGELLAQAIQKQGVTSAEAHRFCHKMAQAISLRRLQKNTPIFLGWNANHLFCSFAIHTKTHWILIQYDPIQKGWHKKMGLLAQDPVGFPNAPWSSSKENTSDSTERALQSQEDAPLSGQMMPSHESIDDKKKSESGEQKLIDPTLVDRPDVLSSPISPSLVFVKHPSVKNPLSTSEPLPSAIAPNSLARSLLSTKPKTDIHPAAPSKPLFDLPVSQSSLLSSREPASPLVKLHKPSHKIKRLLPSLEEKISLHGASMKIFNRSLVYPKKARFSALDVLPESASHVAFSSPIAVGSFKLSSPFGKRRDPWKGCTRMHNGLDLEAPYGTPVLAAATGTVEKISKSRHGYGNHVCLTHTNGYRTIYGHLSFHALHLKPGMKIQRGSLLGYVGSTGRSTGNHLHFEIRKDGQPKDPARILEGLRRIV